MTDHYQAAYQWLVQTHPQVASGLLPARPGVEPRMAALAHRVYACHLRRLMVTGRPESEALEALVYMSVDFLRLQPRFQKTGRYASAGDTTLVERVYSQPEIMAGYYLDGLLLSYAFWQNHTAILAFFLDRFIDALPANATLFEVGTGHGLMALLALETLPAARYVGVDVSPFSIAHAATLLAGNGVAADRFELRCLDARQGLAEVAPAQAVLCCEVLEHVVDPGALLQGLRQALAPGGRAFLTTVANVEADDHVTLFHDVGHIRATLEAGGFRIEQDLALVVPGFEHAVPTPINYAAIVADKEPA